MNNGYVSLADRKGERPMQKEVDVSYRLGRQLLNLEFVIINKCRCNGNAGFDLELYQYDISFCSNYF